MWSTFGNYENSSLWKNLDFQPYISKVAIAMAAKRWKHLYWEKQLLPSSHACMVLHTNPCNFEIFKTVMKYFLKHYRSQISFEFITDKCVRKRLLDMQFKNFRIYTNLYGKSCKRDWVAKVVFLIQILLTFDGRCNRYFGDIRLKISLMSPNFNMLFQLVLTTFFKSELFSCLPKVGHVIKSCKEPRDYKGDTEGIPHIHPLPLTIFQFPIIHSVCPPNFA